MPPTIFMSSECNDANEKKTYGNIEIETQMKITAAGEI